MGSGKADFWVGDGKIGAHRRPIERRSRGTPWRWVPRKSWPKRALASSWPDFFLGIESEQSLGIALKAAVAAVDEVVCRGRGGGQLQIKAAGKDRLDGANVGGDGRAIARVELSPRTQGQSARGRSTKVAQGGRRASEASNDFRSDCIATIASWIAETSSWEVLSASLSP